MWTAFCTEKAKHILQKRNVRIEKIPPLFLFTEYLHIRQQHTGMHLPSAVKQWPDPDKEQVSQQKSFTLCTSNLQHNPRSWGHSIKSLHKQPVLLASCLLPHCDQVPPPVQPQKLLSSFGDRVYSIS